MSSINKFFQLIQSAVKGEKCDLNCFSPEDWAECYEHAQRQSLIGVLFPAVQKYMLDEKGNKIEPLFSEWLGAMVQTDFFNNDLNKKAAMLSRIFKSWGYQTCILKGQGVAQLYPEPSLRQSGDIDIWVRGKQEDIINRLRDQCIGIANIDYVHSGITIFNDASVEVHFRPSWMYNPFTNRKLQKFFKKHAEEQFANNDENVGFSYPTIGFNLVYSLIHINRHIFEEGIGLRQLTDYYYILSHSTKEERNKAFCVFKSLNLKKFVGAIMYAMVNVFDIEKDLLLCEPNAKEGEFLLNEIIIGGNFGFYDNRNKWFEKGHRLEKNLFNAKRNLRYLKHYPSEVVWIPFWKIWHYIWRKRKGYL